MKHPVSLDPIPEQENTKFQTPQIHKTENQWLRPRSNTPHLKINIAWEIEVKIETLTEITGVDKIINNTK